MTVLLPFLLGCSDWFTWASGPKKTPKGDDSTAGDTGGFCEESLSDAAPGGPDCVTSTINCGQTIEATTAGGSDVLDESLYDGWFCGYPFPSSYEGPERVYLLDVTGSKTAHVDLESPCEEVDMFAIHFNDDRCPYEGLPISECDNSWKDGDDSLDLYTSGDYRFFLIVESRSGKPANFRITVTCSG